MLFLWLIDSRIVKKKRFELASRATRGNEIETFGTGDDPELDKYFLTMDNYFTMPKVMKKLREKGIGVVGTARFRKNCPPDKLKEVNIEKVNFNDFYYCIDEHGTLVGRWMDNGLVFCKYFS